MLAQTESLPKVQLDRVQWLRILVVGIAVAFMLLRVVPDTIRLIHPLGVFDYATDDNGVVTKVPERPTKGSDIIEVGDRVRIDRVPEFDRKPGLARIAFTRADFERHLPIERDGAERRLTLHANAESVASRTIMLLRILLYMTVVSFGALLLIVKPRIATVGFFIFCLGGAQPTSFTDSLFDVPWRDVPTWIGDTVTGAAAFGLLVFAFCLAFENHRARVWAGYVLAVGALAFGTLHAYDTWLVIYAGVPAGNLSRIYVDGQLAVNILTAAVFVIAFVRAHGVERQRTGWIVFSFVLAAGGRVLSEHFFPQYLNFWENGALMSLAIVPIIVVWVAIVKHHFFNIDFVVSRALVYTSITVTVIFVLASSEELLTYLFYQNTDLAYGLIIAISMGIGSCFGTVKTWLDRFVDRFMFRERREQRRSLERVASNLLDAGDAEFVWSVLLHEVPSILDLSFSGIMMREERGGYRLTHRWQWPRECVESFTADNPLTREIDRTRGVLSHDAVRSTMIKSLFPNDRFTYAAPLYFDRKVGALVLYGHSVSGLDIDPEERTVLMRVMANASIALGAIEITRYRDALAAQTALAPAQ